MSVPPWLAPLTVFVQVSCSAPFWRRSMEGNFDFRRVLFGKSGVRMSSVMEPCAHWAIRSALEAVDIEWLSPSCGITCHS